MSHELSITVEHQGGWANIPTIVNGEVLSDKKAHAMLGAGLLSPLDDKIYPTANEAVRAAKLRSDLSEPRAGELSEPTMKFLQAVGIPPAVFMGRTPEQVRAIMDSGVYGSIDFARLPEGVGITPKIDIPFTEAFALGFERENPARAIARLLAREWGLEDSPIPEVDENGISYDVMTDPQFQPYIGYAGRFLDSNGRTDTARRIKRLDAERRRDAYLADGGGAARIGQLAGGALGSVVSPTTFAPIPFLGVSSAVARFAGAAGVGAAATFAEELALHKTQMTREAEESLMAMGFVGLISGTLSAAMPTVKSISAGTREFFETARGAANGIRTPLDDMLDRAAESIRPRPRSAGAAATQDTRTTLERMRDELREETFLTTGLKVERIGLNPNLRSGKTASPTHARTIEQLGSLGGIIKAKNVDTEVPQASAHSVESNFATTYLFPMVKTLHAIDEGYVAYRQAIAGQMPTGEGSILKIKAGDLIGRLRQSSNAAISHSEFRSLVGQAMRRGDSAADLTEDAALAASIERAAHAARRHMDNLKADAMRTGLFERPLHREMGFAVARRDSLRGEAQRARANNTELDPEQARELKKAERKVKQLERQIEDMRAFGPTVNTADSYYPRIWRHDYIMRDRARLRNILIDWMRSEGEVNNLGRKADEIIESLLGNRGLLELTDADEFIDVLGDAQAVRQRTLDIPDHLVEDFLESDVEVGIRFLTGSIGNDVKLTEQFGDISMMRQIAQIRKEYEAAIEAAEGMDKKNQLRAQLASDLKDIRGVRDRIRGTYGVPQDPYRPLSRALRIAKTASILTLGGGFMVSSLPDVFRTVMTEGFSRTMKHGLMPLFRNYSTVFREMSQKEVKYAALGLDMSLGLRAMQMADAGDIMGRRFPMERALLRSTNAFFTLNGLNWWNTVMKEFSGTVTGLRIAEVAMAWSRGDIPASDIRKMTRSGIDQAMARRIANQIQKYGQPVDARTNTHLDRRWFTASGEPRAVGESVITPPVSEAARRPSQESVGVPATSDQLAAGDPGLPVPAFNHDDVVWLPNTAAWKDTEALKAYRVALHDDVNRTIVTPGVLDRALWTSTEWGSTIAQFKGFGQASFQRVLISGMQEKDAAFFTGALAMIAMGAAVNELKRVQFNDDREQGFTEILVNAIDRSGILGVAQDVNNILETLTDHRLGMRPLVGAGRPYDSTAGQVVGALGGPAASQLWTARDVALDLMGGQADQYTAKNFRRLLPGQNHPLADPVFDELLGR